MKEYGKPIYLNGEFDGYEYINVYCDECGEEAEYSPDYDCDLCPNCLDKKLVADTGE